MLPVQGYNYDNISSSEIKESLSYFKKATSVLFFLKELKFLFPTTKIPKSLGTPQCS